MTNLVDFWKEYLFVGKKLLFVGKTLGDYHIFFSFYMIYHLDFSIFFFRKLSIRHCQCHKIKFFRQLLHPTNRINRHQNDRCQSTSVILVSATVASDKGSTTLGVRNQVRRGDPLWSPFCFNQWQPIPTGHIFEFCQFPQMVRRNNS